MPQEFSPENIKSRLEEFLSEEETGYVARLRELSVKYPDLRSLEIDWRALDLFDAELSQYLLEHPYDVIHHAEDVVKDLILPEQDKPEKINVRFTHLPADVHIEVREIRAKHVSRFISISGLIRRATDVRPKIIDAAFECIRCHHIIKQRQDSDALREPLECYKEQGGCGKAQGQTQFICKSDISKMRDTQKLELQERPEGLRGGAQPQRLSAWVEDDDCGKIMVGDRVTLSGVLRTYIRDSRQKKTQLEIFLDVNSYEMEAKDYQDVNLSPEDEEKILSASKDPEIFRHIIDSISPTVFGLQKEKESLALLLFGGVAKRMPDGTKVRGDTHVLLIGDPGVAKSQLLRYISEMAPRGIYTAGKTASAAGLTAAAVKDDSFGEGRWVLEAGALVLADMGIACIDELDKMTPQDRSSMHEVMEQQTVSVSKAGITATLQARCTLLGAANPKYGRFDRTKTVSEQIDLPPTLLSRFDIILPLWDIPKTSFDEQMAEHILRGHLIGEKMKEATEAGMETDLSDYRHNLEPHFSSDFMKKYILYARKHAFPIMSPGAMESIKNYYMEIRKKAQGENSPIPITPRQLEAIIRLSEASAKMRLSREVTEEDTKRAIDLIEFSMSKTATEPGAPGGLWDIDIITTGRSRSQWNVVKAVKDALSEMSEENPDGVEFKKLVERVTRGGVDQAKVETTIAKLKESGEIYEPRQGRYKLARQ